METVVIADPNDPDTSRRLYPRDVRNPQSIEESALALDLIDSQIRALRSRRMSYEQRGQPTDRSDGLISQWEARRAEVFYLAEMFRAGNVIDAASQARSRELAHENAVLNSAWINSLSALHTTKRRAANTG